MPKKIFIILICLLMTLCVREVKLHTMIERENHFICEKIINCINELKKVKSPIFQYIFVRNLEIKFNTALLIFIITIVLGKDKFIKILNHQIIRMILIITIIFAIANTYFFVIRY